MSALFLKILELVKQIPSGKVATYGQLAHLVGMPRGARVVGYALAGCTDARVPCHRVVDRFGRTKEVFDTIEHGLQRRLLEEEGVVFLPDGTVDLAKSQWLPEEGSDEK